METELVRVLAAWLHALGVATYVGGAIIMEFVVGPAQKAIPPAQAQVMGKKAADRFLWFAWGSLGLIAVSGLLRLFSTNAEKLLFGSAAFDVSLGRTYLVKSVLWLVLVVNGLIITFVLRPKLSARSGSGTSATQAQSHQQDQVRAANRILWLTRVDLAVAVVLVLLGSSLGFGGFL